MEFSGLENKRLLQRSDRIQNKNQPREKQQQLMYGLSNIVVLAIA